MAGSLKRAKSTQKRCAEVCGARSGGLRAHLRERNIPSRPILGFFQGGNSRGPLERGRAGLGGQVALIVRFRRSYVEI